MMFAQQLWIFPVRHIILQDSAPYFNANANMCNRMYSSSAVCTSSLQTNVFGTNTTNEKAACSYIESLRYGNYDQEGRLYSRANRAVSRHVTESEMWGLIFSLLICAILAVYSCYLHHTITNLFIRSLSHTDLLPPSRSRKSSRSRRRSRSDGRRSSVDKFEDEWTEVEKVPSKRGSSRSGR